LPGAQEVADEKEDAEGGEGDEEEEEEEAKMLLGPSQRS
jgi:hypothetical protein